MCIVVRVSFNSIANCYLKCLLHSSFFKYLLFKNVHEVYRVYWAANSMLEFHSEHSQGVKKIISMSFTQMNSKWRHFLCLNNPGV